ncbi:hypothetical protein D9M71_678080 [compost metagenome]
MAAQAHRQTSEAVGTFYWPNRLSDPAALVFRRPTEAGEGRSVDEISLHELLALARAMAASGLRGGDLLYCMAREVGLQKVSASTRSRLQQAIEALAGT